MNVQDVWKNSRKIIIASVAAIIALVAVGYYYSQKSAERSAISAERQKAEEKQKILEALSAPREQGAPEISAEEKQKVLEALSAPRPASPESSVKSPGSKTPAQTPAMSAEEKQKILEALSAPQQ